MRINRSCNVQNTVILITLVTTLVVSLFSQSLAAKETIQWLWFEQAPYFIGKNPRAGTGIGDELTRYFQDNLPEYEHQNIRVNTIRYNSMIKGQDVCVPVAWLSENEEQHLIQTRPHTLEPPAGIYIHKSKQHLFGKPGDELSLKKLLLNKDLKLGALRGMEYSAEVDQLLETHKANRNVTLIDAPITEISLNLLKLNRLDYLLGLPSQNRHKELLHHQQGDTYQFFNIEEISRYVPMYAHCSNNERGRKIVSKLNTLLTDARLIQSIEKYEYWYEGNHRFRKLFMDHIINKLPNPSTKDM